MHATKEMNFFLFFLRTNDRDFSHHLAKTKKTERVVMAEKKKKKGGGGGKKKKKAGENVYEGLLEYKFVLKTFI